MSFASGISGGGYVCHCENTKDNQHHRLPAPLEHGEGLSFGIGNAIYGEAEHDGDVPGSQTSVAWHSHADGTEHECHQTRGQAECQRAFRAKRGCEWEGIESHV